MSANFPELMGDPQKVEWIQNSISVKKKKKSPRQGICGLFPFTLFGPIYWLTVNHICVCVLVAKSGCESITILSVTFWHSPETGSHLSLPFIYFLFIFHTTVSSLTLPAQLSLGYIYCFINFWEYGDYGNWLIGRYFYFVLSSVDGSQTTEKNDQNKI